MAYRETAPTTERDDVDNAVVERLHRQTAERELGKAQRVGDVSGHLRKTADTLLVEGKRPDTEAGHGDDELAGTSAANRAAAAAKLRQTADTVERGTRQYGDLTLDHKLRNTSTQGYAYRGGGRAKVAMNPDMQLRIMNGGGQDAVTEFNKTGAHEVKGHAEGQAEQHAVLIKEGKPMDAFDMDEGHAQIVEKEAVGESTTSTPNNRPADYVEAHGEVVETLSLVPRQKLDAVMKGGDPTEAQAELWRQELADNTLTTQQVWEAGQKNNATEAAKLALKRYAGTRQAGLAKVG